jgi:N-sulfoglucosamine sulfohydrolase
MPGLSALFHAHGGTTAVQAGEPPRTAVTEVHHARLPRSGCGMPVKSRLLALAALLWLASSSCNLSSKTAASAPQQQVRPMNVLLITADDLGLQVGAYGETLIQTPNIDGLAAAGARFEVAYVAQPSCSPSRAALFTGMYSHSTGQYGLTDTGLALHEELRNATIPNLLKQAGYRTGLIGKLHVNPESSFQFDYRPVVNARIVREVAQKADEFFASSGDQPFFLMVNYFDPHADPNVFNSQVDGLPEAPLQPGPAVIFRWQQTDTPAHETRTAGYYSAVQRLDAGIGMLMDTLQRHNLLENTLVIFVGDNGPPFTRGKISVYENGIRTPFIVLWPGVSRVADVNKAMVSTVDILPTILDATGQPIPTHVQGESLRSALSDTTYAGRAYLVAEHHFHIKKPFTPQRAIRNQRFKLIHNLRSGAVQPILGVDGCSAYFISRQPEYVGTAVRATFDTFATPPEFELYDLVNDPIEFHNLAADPLYQDVLTELKSALMAWRKDTNDPFLDQAFMDYYINFSLSP